MDILLLLVLELLGYSKEKFLEHYSTYLTDAPCNEKIGGYREKVLAGSKQAVYEIEMYKKIHQSGERLLSLLNYLLDWSKLEGGKLEFNFKESDT